MGKRGRPSKLTPEVQKQLVKLIQAGNHYETACACVGITYRTFRNWMEKGEKAKGGKYFHFFQAITQANYQAEARMVIEWQKHFKKDYRAIRDFMERRFPERWSKAAAGSTSVHIDVSAFSRLLDDVAVNVWDEDDDHVSEE